MKKLLLVSLVACSLDVPEESRTESASVRRCSLLLCGENAASAGDGWMFDEFDLFGAPNYAGTRLVGGHIYTSTGAWIPVMPWISLDELYMFDPATWMVYAGWQLVDGQAQLEFEHEEDGVTIFLKVTNYQAQIEHFRSGEAELVPVYQFEAMTTHPDHDTFTPICQGLDGEPPWAVVFRGDRYSENLKVVPNDPASGWSFLACNGSAAMKMHLQRHTYASQYDDDFNLAYPTSLKQRTALLKAITADYCGIGHAFTVTGTDLAFATAQDPARFPEPYASLADIDRIEALWTHTGASCLHEEPRFAERWEVDAMCGIPTCGTSGNTPPPSWELQVHAITAVPNP